MNHGVGNLVKPYPGMSADLSGTGLSRGNKVRVLTALFNQLPLDYLWFACIPGRYWESARHLFIQVKW